MLKGKFKANVLLIMLMIVLSFFINTNIYGEDDITGLGTEESPFIIYTFQGLEKIGTDSYPLDAIYKLGSDIDASPTNDNDYNYGRGWDPLGEIYDIENQEWEGFSGVFDGQGYNISNLYINIDYHNDESVALFRILDDGLIKNLDLIDIDIKGSGPTGGLVAYNNGIIEEINVSGKIRGIFFVGGLVGSNSEHGQIINSSSFVDVEGTMYIGGLAGESSGKVEGSYSLGNITGIKVPDIIGELVNFEIIDIYGAGGLIGLNSGIVRNTYAIGNVAAEDSVGGLVGINIGIVEKSAALGDVEGSLSTGGLVGSNGSFFWGGGLILNTYACGNIEGSRNVGGLVGNNNGDINKSYAVGRIRGAYLSTKGIAGNNEGVRNSFYRVGMGERYTAGIRTGILRLKQEETYRSFDYEDDWDFDSIWAIDEGQTYPYLRNNLRDNEVIQEHPKVKALYPKYEVMQTDQVEKYIGPDIAGSGSEEDPFLIYTFKGLEKMGTENYSLDSYYKLARNIDASPSNEKSYNNGRGWIPIGEFNSMTTYLGSGEIDIDWIPFEGVFDGQGYQISNLFIYRVNSGYAGLFTGLNENGIIKNVDLVNVNIKASSAGGLIGYNRGFVENCFVSGILETNEYLGGLISKNDGKVLNSSTDINVEGLGTVGGLVANNSGEIINSSSNGRVVGNIYIGGLIGENSGIIRESKSRADVVGNIYIGGLVGSNEKSGYIISSYAEGFVKGYRRAIDNLIGLNKDGKVLSSYAKADVEEDKIEELQEGIQEDIEIEEFDSVNVIDYSDNILWELELDKIDGNLVLSPDEKNIYVPADYDSLYSIDINGEINWSFEVNYNYFNPVVGEDGTIYAIDDQGVSSKLFALREDGSRSWSYHIGNSKANLALGYNGTIYIDSTVDGLFAINPDGSEKWLFQMGETYISSAIAEDDTIYIGDYYGLYAINPDGSEKWYWEYPYYSYDENESYGLTIGRDGTIYLPGHINKLYAVVPDGTTRWIFESEGNVQARPAVDDNGNVYLGCDEGYLYSIDPSGKENWRVKFEGFIESTPVLGLDGTIYLAMGNFKYSYDDEADGNIYAVSLDGRVLWSIDSGFMNKSSIVISSNGILYIGTSEGELYAIGDQYVETKTVDESFLDYQGEEDEDNSLKLSLINERLITKNEKYSSYNLDLNLSNDEIKYYNAKMFGTDLSNSFYFDTHGIASTPVMKWRFNTYDSISEPAVVNDIGYFGTFVGEVYAVDIKTGQEIWIFETSDAVTGSPTVVDETVYFGSHNGSLYAVDALTGKEEWKLKISGGVADYPGGGIDSALKVSEGVLYFGNYDKCVYAVDIDRREIKWKYETNDFVLTTPAIADDTIYIANDSEYLYALDIETGREKWILQGSGTPPLVNEGIVYFSSYYNNIFYAVDAKTGQSIWEIQLDDGMRGYPSIYNGYLYIASGNKLLAVDAKKGLKQEVFKNDNGGFASVLGPLAIAEEIIYVVNRDNLKAININSWDLLWEFSFDDNVYTFPIIANGIIYLGGYNGDLYAISAGEDSIPEMLTVEAGSYKGNIEDISIELDYEISKYPVLNKEFVKFLNSAKVSSDGTYQDQLVISVNEEKSHILYKEGQFVVEDGKEDYPVVLVTYYGTLVYCNWLSETVGLPKAYYEEIHDRIFEGFANKQGYRLATEDEWIYAAQFDNEQININDYAWYWDNSINQDNKMYKDRGTHPVGQKKANIFGIYDMLGNVWEWCHDGILRGGSWGSSADVCQNDSRREDDIFMMLYHYEDIAVSNYYTGFRIVRTR